MLRVLGTSSTSRIVARAIATTAIAAAATVASDARADPSSLAPEVGYNYGQTESPRIAAMGGALRAFSNSTESLFENPANMAVTRVYHIAAIAQIWPEAARQSYGAAIVDSIVSSSHLAGGLSATWTSQDPDGVDRTALDVRFALAYPFSDHVFLGATARYLSLKQSGSPLGTYDLSPSIAAGGLSGKPIVQNLSFDAGLTIKPVQEVALSVVGYNLGDNGQGFMPLMLGGGAGFGTQDFTIEADLLGDFTTYGTTKTRAMLGGEYLLADHFPIRAGYRYDQGQQSHTIAGGLGYIDNAYSVEVGFEHNVVGPASTAIILGFKYHVESLGLEPQDTEQ